VLACHPAESVLGGGSAPPPPQGCPPLLVLSVGFPGTSLESIYLSFVSTCSAFALSHPKPSTSQAVTVLCLSRGCVWTFPSASPRLSPPHRVPRFLFPRCASGTPARAGLLLALVPAPPLRSLQPRPLLLCRASAGRQGACSLRHRGHLHPNPALAMKISRQITAQPLPRLGARSRQLPVQHRPRAASQSLEWQL